jgi:hypothetical protein
MRTHGGWTIDDVNKRALRGDYFLVVDSKGEQLCSAASIARSWTALEPAAVLVLVDSDMIFELRSILKQEES